MSLIQEYQLVIKKRDAQLTKLQNYSLVHLPRKINNTIKTNQLMLNRQPQLNHTCLPNCIIWDILWLTVKNIPH